MIRKWLLILMIILVGLPATFTVQAQTANQVATSSGRLSLELPVGWTSRLMPDESELRGLDSETLVFGTSEDAIGRFLARRSFDGTVAFISAYPYSAFPPAVVGSPVDMLMQITPYSFTELIRTSFGGYEGVEFLYFDPDGEYFIWDILFDTGELTYRLIAYSTRMDDYSLLTATVNGMTYTPGTLDAALNQSQPIVSVATSDSRLSFEIPQSWLYWIETDNILSFASTGAAYDGLSYSFRPETSSEIAFVVQRFIKSALRADELAADGTTDLPAVAKRLASENSGLSKDKPIPVNTWQGIPRMDAAWLVSGTDETLMARTVVLDATDVVYFIQAQFKADMANVFQPVADAIMDSMTYTPPARYLDSSVIGIEPGMTAPGFTLPMLDGGEGSLESYRGQVVLMNMWASWCGPCHAEAPHLQKLYSEYDGRFELLAVNVGETAYEAGPFVQQYGLTFPVMLDSEERVARLYGLRAYPTTYFIGWDGVILEVVIGSFTEQALRDLLAIYVGR